MGSFPDDKGHPMIGKGWRAAGFAEDQRIVAWRGSRTNLRPPRAARTAFPRHFPGGFDWVSGNNPAATTDH